MSIIPKPQLAQINLETVEDQHQAHSPPGNSASVAGLKHGNDSCGKFLSVPGKSSFGN